MEKVFMKKSFVGFQVRRKLVFFFCVFLSLQIEVYSQLINSDFELSDPTSWSISNSSPTNQWVVGSAVASSGAQSAYISVDSGSTNSYNISVASVSHLYKQVSFPAGETAILLSFDWKGIGEISSTGGVTYDYLRVSLSTTIPVLGTMPTLTDQLPIVYCGQPGFVKAYIQIPASMAGLSKYLIFSFISDGSIGSATPGMVIDNVILTSANAIPLTGVKTISNGGGADFISIGQAIATLNANGVGTGGVTFNVLAGSSYAETMPAILVNGSSTNPILFQKSGVGVNPFVLSTGTGNYGPTSLNSLNGSGDAVLALSGADYVTWDGIDLFVGDYSSGQSCIEFGVLLRNASPTNGAQHNTIKNCTITLNRTNTAPSIGIVQTSNLSYGGQIPTSTAGANSYNKFYNYYIQNAAAGIYMYGNAAFPDIACELGTTNPNQWSTIGAMTSNDIGNSTFATFGIRISYQDSIKIFRNIIRNITGTSSSTLDGIWIDHSGTSTSTTGKIEIYNNRIYDLNNTSSIAGVVIGIRDNLTDNIGSQSSIYNNFIFGLNSSSTITTSRRIIGIQAQESGTANASSHRFWNNSVLLNPTNTATSNSCYEATSTNCTYDIRNNIFSNATANQTGLAQHFCLVTNVAGQLGGVASVADYNDYFVTNSGNGFIGRLASNNYSSISAWKAALVGNDVNSISLNPNFISSTDLHIQSSEVNVNNVGVVISQVSNDIDNEVRSLSAPDIGADEYTPSVCFGLPTAGVLSSSTTTSACVPSSFTINITGNSGGSGVVYDWQQSSSPAGPYVSLSAPNVSSLNTNVLSTGTHYFRCVVTCSLSVLSAVTDTLSLTIHPTITATINPTNATICPGTSQALIAGPTGGGNVFSWNTGASASFIIVTPSSSSNYSVTVTAPTGCTSQATAHIQVYPKITSSVSAFPPSICSGSSTQLSTKVNGVVNLKFTEITQFRVGAGSTPSYASHIVGEDLIEISNWGELPLDISGMVYELWRDTSLSVSYTFLPGTILPSQKTLVLCLGSGVNNDTLLYFNTGGLNDQLGSGVLTGHLIRNGTDIIDVVALNGYVWTASSKVISSDWSGSILNSSTRAGVIRSANSDNNLSSDWIVSDIPSPTQSIGSYNGSYVPQSILVSHSWSPLANLNSNTIYNPFASNVTTTTVFRDTITTTFGCKTIAPITVSSGLPIICSPLVVSYPRCANENFTVKAVYTGGGYPNHYTWTRDNVGGLYPDTSTITANLPPGTYNFKVFIDDTCGGLCSQNINVVVSPVPAPIATGPLTGLTYSNLTYQVSGFIPGSTFQWQQQYATLSNVSGGGAITIVDNAISNPYPSTISVSGKSNTAKLVAVRINGLSHTYPADIAMVLVSPTGQALELMAEAGGYLGNVISNVNLTFSDTASSFLSNTQIVSGSFKPTTGGFVKTWPAPGPGTLNQVNPQFNSLIGNVNGSWKLFIYDDEGQDAGSLASWSLDFIDGPAPSNIANANDSILVVQANSAGTINYSCVCTAPSGCSSVSNAATTVVAVLNDNVCSAIPLSIGLNGPFTNQGATVQLGEVFPGTGNCNSQTTWCTSQTISNTVWFKFVAPSSGRVSLHFIQPDWDSQIAIWSADSCASLLTLNNRTLIAANDDSSAAPYNAYIDKICLIAGKTYYVQVDGYNATTNNNFNLLLLDEGDIPQLTASNGLSSCIRENFSTVLSTTQMYNSYLWSNGSTGSTFTASVAGTYIVTVSSDSGCFSIDSITISIPEETVAPNIAWQNSLGGSNQDGSYDIQKDFDGGYVVAGYSSSINSGDVNVGLLGGGGAERTLNNFWLFKLNANGDPFWTKTYGGSRDEVAKAICPTVDGGYVTAGYTYSNDIDVLGSNANQFTSDSWTIKLDISNSTPALTWQKPIGGTNDEEITEDIVLSTDSNYVLVGSVATNNEDKDGSIIKVSPAGNIIWSKYYYSNSSAFEHGFNSVDKTGDGGYIVAGAHNENINYTPKFWIMKLDGVGDLVWEKSLGGSGEERAYCVRQTGDGGYIVAGSSNSNNGNVSGNHGLEDYWIVKLNALGNIEWQRSLGGSGDEHARSVEQTVDGGYIIAGYSNSNNGDVTGNHGGFDYWLVKLNAQGALTWQKSFGGTGNDFAYSIKPINGGGYIVTGMSNSINGDLTENHGQSDVWVVKLGAFQPQIIASSNLPLCDSVNNPITLTASAASNYLWSNGATTQSIVVTPPSSPQENYYSVVVNSMDGCFDSDSIAVQYKSFVPPVIASVSGDTICPNSTTVLTLNTGYNNYYWSTAQTNSQIQVGAGLYNVMVTAANGCTGTAIGLVKAYETNVPPLIEWKKSLGGTLSDSANSITITHDGYYLIAGVSNSNNGDVHGNLGNNDYWVAKLNLDGDTVWTRNYGGSSIDAINSIIEFKNDTGGYTYIISGRSNSPVTAGGKNSPPLGSNDYWTLELDQNGNKIIEFAHGAGGDDISNAIVSTRVSSGFGSNVIALAGASSSSVNYWTQADKKIYYTNNNGLKDFFIIKLTTQLAFANYMYLGGSGDDIAKTMIRTPNEELVVAGYSNSTNGDRTIGNHGANNDFWIAKLHMEGGIGNTVPTKLLWQKSYGGSGDDQAQSMIATVDGGYVIAGFSNSLDGDVIGGHGNYDYWIIKIDKNGNIEWQKSFGGAGDDKAISIQQSFDGGFIIAGHSNSNNSGDVIGNHGGYDYWILKLDVNGTLIYQKPMGGSLNDFATGIQKSPDGGYLVSGHSFSNDLDIAGDHHGATSNSDIWIAKLTNGKATISPDSVVALCTDDPGTTVTLTASGGNSFLWNNGATTQSINVNQSGNFYVNIDNTNHCFVSDTVVVNALPFVDPDVISNSGTDFCESLSSILSVTPSYASYLWSNGSTSSSIDVSIVGTYKVTVTAANGCTSVDSLAITGPAGINAPGHIEWQKAFGGSALDYPNDLYRTLDGGYLLSGTTESFDGDVTGNHGFSDFWLARIDTFENIQWQKAIGGSNGEQATCMRPTKDGGSIAVGYSNSNNYDVIGNHGGTDFFVVKTDFQGTIQWSKVLGGPLYDAASSVEQTADGGYLVAGFSAGNGGDVSGNHGGFDAWIVKLNSNGTVSWKKSYGGSGNDYSTAVKQTADQGYVLVGYTSSSNGDITTTNYGNNDYWILKLNVAGDVQWSKTYGGSNWDQATAVQQLPDGGFIVAGYTESTNNDVIGNHGAYDFWVLRLNAIGNIVWKKAYGGSLWDLAVAIEQTPEGGFLIGGYTSSNNNGDVGANHGGSDFWLLKVDANGNIIWNQLTGGSGDEEAAALFLEKDGSYVMGGYSTSFDGDANGSGNHGAGDYWVVKFTNKASIFPSDSLFANCGDSIILTANNANTYLWNTGATTQSIIVYNAGDYYVSTNGQSDCFNSDTVHVTVYDPPSTGTISVSTTNVSGVHSYFTLNNAPNNAIFQWGWGLQPGGPYTNFGTGGTYDSLQLVGVGTAYVVCTMTFGGTNGCVYTSNEIPLVLSIPYDSVCNAAQLTMGLNGPFTNYGATAETGEAIPPTVTCNSQASWCPNQTLNNTVWFKFTAPASGKVSIHFIQPNWDSQIAVWSAPDCNALLNGGATLIAANDDSTTVAPFNAYIAPVCLTPGKEYFIQVDGFDNVANTSFNLLLIDENNSLSFDGSNDIVTSTGSAISLSNSSFTVEVYAKRKTLGTDDIFISQGTGSNNLGLHIGFRNSNVFTFAFYGNDLNTTVAFTDTLWHLWSCVYSTTGIGNNRFIYRDGVLVASDRATANYTGSGVFQLGVSSYLSGYSYGGSLDEVRIWNTARTTSQILQGLGQEVVTPQAGLQLYYKFNNGVAGTNNVGLTTVADVSGNSRNGTLSNFALSGTISNWSNGVTRTLYRDVDEDGYYSNTLDSLTGFCIPIGYAAVGGDCYDSVATSNPSNLYEISCNGVDDNCNGQIDENNSISFDGSNDYIEGINTLLPQGNAARTVEAWINPSITQNGAIFNWSSTATNNTRAGILLVSGKLYYVGQSNDLSGVATIPLNTWTHVAATFDGITVKLYVNGELDASAPKTFNTTGTTFTIGRSSVPLVQEYFNGKLDEIRVWNIARTQAQIRSSMLNGLPSTQTGMIGYYKFDQGITNGANAGLTLLPDVSSTTNKGTLFNFALTGTTSNWTTGSINITTLYRDYDNDGYGSQTVSTNTFCTGGNIFIGNNLDCNDSAATVHPGAGGTAFEVSCNGVDDNCNGQIDENNSLSFDGTSDYVSIPHSASISPGTSTLTLEAWVNVTSNVSNQVIIHKWIVNQYALEITGTKARFSLRSSNGNTYNVDAPNAFPVNQWVHVAGVFNGNNLYLYQNGVLVSVAPFFGAPITGGSGNLTFGRRSEVATGFLLGRIDEASIWNVARTSAQILTDMKSGYAFPQSGLSAYYKFNQGIAAGSNTSETTLYDASSLANHGTLNSFTLTGASSNFVSGNAPVSYPDIDQDGYYEVATGIQTNSCVAFNYAVAGGDCNNNNVNINPGINEINCNATDDNCNSTIDENISLNFDGTNDEVIIPGRTSLNLSNFTVELWVKPTGTKPAYQTIVLKEGASGNRNYGLFLNPNATSLHFSFLRADNVTYESYNSNSSLPLNVWSHVAMTYNGSAFRLYINGILDRSVAVSSTPIQTTQDLRLGRGPGALSPFVGSMDEVRIWNVARTQLELETAMTNGLLMPQNNLVAYYKFDQGTINGTNTGQTTLLDVSGLEHHGSLLNFALSGTTSNFTTGAGTLPTLYQDLDGDFYGNPNITTTSFCNGSIYVGNNTDCNDTNVTVLPTNINEVICNGTDDNCNGIVDENNGLNFDGVNDLVTLNHFARPNFMTIEAWVKIPVNGSANGIIVGWGGAGTSVEFICFGGTLAYHEWNGSIFPGVSSPTPINDNNWHHVAVVRNGSGLNNIKLYQDGLLVAFGTSATTITTTNLNIGAYVYSGTPGRFFNGTIDEVRIWNSARTNAQISGNFNRELPPSTAGLLAYYNFNRGIPNGNNSGLTTLPDFSGNNNSGTISNFTMNGSTSNWSTGVSTTMYPDVDQDGFYNSTAGAMTGFCFPPGYAMVGGDCNDGIASVNPATQEIICNGLDDNCNGVVDENNSLVFDGVNDFIAVPPPFISNAQITIESWIYKSVSSGIKSIYSTDGFTTGDIQLNLVNNNVVLSIAGNVPYDVNLTNVPDNIWTHIAVVYDASAKNVVCYLNGMNAGTYNYTTAFNIINEAGRLGGWNGSSTRHYVGRLDEFRIWNSARTLAQVFQNMNVTVPSSAAGLLINYNFDQGISGANNFSVNQVFDRSGNLLNGVLNNFNLSGSNSNWMVGVSRTWYLDADGDSYGSKLDSVLGLCSPLGYVINNDDCNDFDANVHIPQVYYADYDQDEYGTGAQVFLCESTPPVGYSINNADCNDIDSTVQTLALYYVDMDQDGYGVGNGVFLCAEVAPVGYSNVNTDCNDGDPLIHQPVYYFMDVDGDGYGGNNSLTYCTSIVPSGYVSNNLDCNDGDVSIHPAASEICGNGIDENCNGLIDEGDFVLPIIISTDGPAQFCQPDSVLLTATIPGNRYAVEVLNFSSEYGPIDWSANMILGAPDVYPLYGDIPLAWAPSSTSGTREFIELRFDDPRPINYIDIYETHATGAVDTVYIKNPNTGMFEMVYTNTAHPLLPVARILHITFPTTGYPVSEIRIAINNSAVPDWNEFDAVSIGITPDLPYTYLWSTGDTVPQIFASQEGNYSVLVTNGSGCMSSNAIFVANSSPLLLTSTNNLCSSTSDGSALVIVQNIPRFLKITSPVSTEYVISGALFGPQLSNFPINGDIVYITNDSLLYDGCAGFPPASLVGKIALIDRGSCPFEQKVYRAQEAGAIGVIIVNNVPGPPFTMGAANLFIDTIPVVMVSDVDGLAIKNWLSQPVVVSAQTDAYTYLWNTGATTSTIENLSAGMYTVTVSNTVGCTSVVSVEVTAAFNTEILAGGPTTICQGDSVKLTIGFETAMQFNGVDQWIDLGGDITNLDDGSFTIEAWIKTTGNSEGIVTSSDNNGVWDSGERAFYIDGFGRPSFVGYGNNFIVGLTAVNDGNWHHVAVSKMTNGSGRMYIDGDDRTLVSGYTVNNIPNIGSFSIGKPNFLEAPNYFNGEIDEVRIWNIARSQSQINNNKFARLMNDTVGLLANYKMNESAGATVINAVSNQFTGTTINAPMRVTAGEPYSYVWTPGGENSSSIYVTSSGNYQVSITSQQGCVVNTLPITINTITCSGGVTVNLGLFVEGFYFGGGTLQSTLLNSGIGLDPNECDTIIVELRDPMSPSTLVEADTVVLLVNGTAIVNFSSMINGNSYYISVRGRNAVQTWSNLPITFTSMTNYNFSTAASQAYGDNQVQVESGVWAIYSGDLSPQDEFIDILDQGVLDNDIFNFAAGYVVSDLNGDGFVDIVDQSIVDNNIFNFIGSIHP